MAVDNQSGMQCAEFENLLGAALDQELSPAARTEFDRHSRTCSLCGPLFADAQAGQRWLKSLPVAEPAPNLVPNILAATTGFDTGWAASAARGPQTSWSERIREWTGALVNPVVAVARQPRFAMSFGMVFFSLSISLSLAGVKVSDLRHADLRPSAIKRGYYEASGRVVKYYENIRFVYEIESRVRDFKRATVPEAPVQEPEEDKKDQKRKTGGQSSRTSEHGESQAGKQQNRPHATVPEDRQQRRYSDDENEQVLAAIPNDAPVIDALL
ncbi:MAG: zf-HC2 domain-containing protein, partial [Acidobacteriales bacterium]|nr:zf-HC2 domain-containing protein [Terriglobales bacterium]